MTNAPALLALARSVVLGPTSENTRALADAVLDDELVRLAHQVRAGGPFAVRRAIELAALIVASERERIHRAESSTGLEG